MEKVEKGHPPGWVEFKETSLDEETDGRRKSEQKRAVPKIDPKSLNEISLEDEEENPTVQKLQNPKQPNGEVFFKSTPKANGQSKEVAKIQISSDATSSPKKSLTSNGKSHSSNLNSKNEVVMGVGQQTGANGASIGEPRSFKTGKLLTSVYPTNQHCAWLVPPNYDPDKMPKILAHEQVQLQPLTYVEIMKSITADIRFSSYCVLYSRVLPVWVLLSILVLLIVLFSSPSGGLPVMVFTFIWMFMLLLGIFFCVIIRKHLAIALRHSVKEANRLAFPHKLLVGVQDRGQLSCHKVVILFIFYETDGCQEDVARLVRVSQANSTIARPVPLGDSELSEFSGQLLLQYSQQYVKAYMKKQLLFPTRPIEGVSDFRPKHCAKSYCMCQFIEKEHFNKKHKRTWYERLV